MEVMNNIVDRITGFNNAVTTVQNNVNSPSDFVNAAENSSSAVLEAVAAHPMPETVSALGGSTQAAVTAAPNTMVTATAMEDIRLTNTEEDIKLSAKVMETEAHPTKAKHVLGSCTKLEEELQSVNMKDQQQPEKMGGVNLTNATPSDISSLSIPGEPFPDTKISVTAESKDGHVALRSRMNKIGKQYSGGPTTTSAKEAWKHGHEPPLTPHPPQKNKDTHYPYRPPRVDEKLYQAEIQPLLRPVKMRWSDRSLRKDSSGGLQQQQRGPISRQKDKDIPETGGAVETAAAVSPPLELHPPRSDDQPGTGKQLPAMPSDSMRPGQVHLDEYEVWNPALAGNDIDNFLSYCRRLAVQAEGGGFETCVVGRGGSVVSYRNPDEDGEGDTSAELKASQPLESDEVQLNWLKVHGGDVENACLHSAALVSCGTAQRSLDIEEHYIGNPRLQMGSWQARRLRRFAPLGGYTCTSDGLRSYGMVSHRKDPTAPPHNSAPTITPMVSLGSEEGGDPLPPPLMNTGSNSSSTSKKTVENGVSQEKTVDGGTSPGNPVTMESSPENQQQVVVTAADNCTSESTTTPPPPPQSIPTRSRNSSELGRRGADRAEYKARWRNILRTAEEYILYANSQSSLKPSLQACIDVLNDASSLPPPEQSPGEDFVSQVSAALAALSTLVNRTRIWTSRVLDALSSKKAAGDSESEDDDCEDEPEDRNTVRLGGLRREKLSCVFPEKGRMSVPEAKKLLMEVKTLALVTNEEKLLHKVIGQAEAWEVKAMLSITACNKAGSSERGWKANNNKQINWASYIVALIEESAGIPLRLKSESILRKHLLNADAIARKLISLVPLCHTNGRGGQQQKKSPLNEIIAISEELDRTGMRYPITAFARERICAAKKWKKEAQTALSGTVALKVLQSLVSESSSLSFDVLEISMPLVSKLDRAMEWLDRVKKAVPKKQRTTYTRGYMPPGGGYSMDSSRTPAIEEDRKVNLNEARVLLEEGGGHGVEMEAKEVTHMSSLVETAEEWMGRVRVMLEVGEETDLQTLNDILMEADSIPVTMDEQQVLKVGIKARQWKMRVAQVMGYEIDQDSEQQQRYHGKEEESGERDGTTNSSSATERKLISFADLRSLSQEASVLRAMFPANTRSSPIYGLLEDRRLQSLLQKAESWVARAGRLSADLQSGRLVTITRCTELITEADLLPLTIHEMDSWRIIKEALTEVLPWMEKSSGVLEGCGIKVDKVNNKNTTLPPQLPLSCSKNEGDDVMAMEVDEGRVSSETRGHPQGSDAIGMADGHHHPVVPEDRMEEEVGESTHTTRKIPFSEATKCYAEAEHLQCGKCLREVRELRKILSKYNEWKVTVDKLCPPLTLTQDSTLSQHTEPQNNGISELQKEPPQGEISQPLSPNSGTGGGGGSSVSLGRRRRRQKPEEEEKYCKPSLQQFVDACIAGNELPIDLTEPLEQLTKLLESAKQWKSKAKATILLILKNISSDTQIRKELKSIPVPSCDSNSNVVEAAARLVMLPPTTSVPQPQLEPNRQLSSPQEGAAAAVVISPEDVVNPSAAVLPVPEVDSAEVSTSDAVVDPLSMNTLPPPSTALVGEENSGGISVSSNNGSEEVSQSIGSAGVMNVCNEEALDEKEEQYIDDLKNLVEEAKLLYVVVAEEKLCEQLLDAIVWAQDVRRLCVSGSCFTGSKGPTVMEARDIAKAGEKSGLVATTLSKLEWEEEDIKQGLLYLQMFLKTYQDDAAPLADRLQASNEWVERAKKSMESSDTPPAKLRELLKQATGMGFNNIELKKKIKAEVQKNNLWFQKAKAIVSGTAYLTLSATKKLVAEGEKVRGAADLVRQLKIEVKSAGKWLALVKKTGLQQGTATMAELKALIPQASHIRVDLSSELKVLHLATSVHCICRKGATASSFMLSCVHCREQFHGHCLGIKKDNDAMKPEMLEKYFCVMCRIRKLYRESEDMIIGAFKRWVPYAMQICSPGTTTADGKLSELGRENFNALAKVMKDALQMPHENVRFNVQVFDEVASNISALDHLMWPPGPEGKQQYNEAKLMLQCLRTVLWATMAQWVFRGRPCASTVMMLVQQASCLSIMDDELSTFLESMAKRCLEWCNDARQLLTPPPPTQRDRPIELNKLKTLSASVQLLPFNMKEENMIMSVLEDEGVRYCICRAANDGGFMIGCDRCEVWYHGRCCSLSQSNSPSEFICESCCEEDEVEYPFPPMKVVPIPQDDEPLDTEPEKETVRDFEPLWPSRAVLSLLECAPFAGDGGVGSVPFFHNANSAVATLHNISHTSKAEESFFPSPPSQQQQNVQSAVAAAAVSNEQQDLKNTVLPVHAPPQDGKSSHPPSLLQGSEQQRSLPYQLGGSSAAGQPFSVPTSGALTIAQQGQEEMYSLQQQTVQRPSAGNLHPPSSMEVGLMASGISYPSAGVCMPPQQWSSGIKMNGSCQLVNPSSSCKYVNNNSWHTPTVHGYGSSNTQQNSMYPGDLGGNSMSVQPPTVPACLHLPEDNRMGSVVAQNTPPTDSKKAHVLNEGSVPVSEGTSEGQANAGVDSLLPVDEPLPKRQKHKV